MKTIKGILSKEDERKKERIKFSVLKRIKWQPANACFQLSKNEKYARHERFLLDTKIMCQKRVIEEIKRSWGLLPYAKTEAFQECWALANLQPLEVSKNRKKWIKEI